MKSLVKFCFVFGEPTRSMIETVTVSQDLDKEQISVILYLLSPALYSKGLPFKNTRINTQEEKAHVDIRPSIRLKTKCCRPL